MKNRLVIILFLLIASGAGAQDLPEGGAIDLVKSGKDKRIKLNFGDELVKGQFETPEGSITNTNKNFNYKRLLKIRENFNPEMDKSKNAFQK